MTIRQAKREAVKTEMHMHPCPCFLHAITMRHTAPEDIAAHNSAISDLAGAPNYNREVIRSLRQRVGVK